MMLVKRKNIRRSRAVLAGFAGALALAAAVPTTAAASSDSTGYEPQVTTVASGLDNPRGLAFDSWGRLYVAEAGKGGSGPCVPGPEGGDVCLGSSGAVTVVTHHGQWRVARGLPSLAAPDGTSAIGPSDVAPRFGSLLFTVGLGLNPAVRGDLPAAGRRLGTLQRLSWGHLRQVADLAGFEAANDPDGNVPDSNPNSVVRSWYGSVVADAGGNDLLTVRPSGRTSVLAVFPDRIVSGPGGMMPMQAVPTSVVRGPGGAYYVSQLTGFPFPVGGARIYRVVPGHAPQVIAGGFTNVIDLAFDRWGRLYVLEIAANGLLSGDPTGALIRVGRDGSQHVVLSDGLVAPGGLAIRGGYAYVSNNSIFPGTGEILRVPLR